MSERLLQEAGIRPTLSNMSDESYDDYLVLLGTEKLREEVAGMPGEDSRGWLQETSESRCGAGGVAAGLVGTAGSDRTDGGMPMGSAPSGHRYPRLCALAASSNSNIGSLGSVRGRHLARC